MVDLLKNLEFDADGNLVPRLSEYLNCTDEGMEWTGTFFVPTLQGKAALSPLYTIEEGGTYNSAIQSNIDNEFHAPPAGCVGTTVLTTAGNMGGILIGAGSTASASIVNGLTIQNPEEAAYPAVISMVTTTSVLVDSPGSHHHVQADIIANGVAGLMPKELNMYAPSTNFARFRFDLPGRTTTVTNIAPGDNAVFNLELEVTAGEESESNIGIYLWAAYHRVTTTSLEAL